MFGYKLLLTGAVLLLSTNVLAMDKVSGVQCAFSPHLQCSAEGKLLWSKPWMKDPTPITIEDTRAYLSQNNTALSIKLRTGEIAWTAHTGNDTRYFEPVIDDRYTYLARTDGNLEKRQKHTGNLLWSKALGPGWIYPPIMTGNKLITAGQDRTLWILEPESGAIQAHIPLSQELVAPLFHLDDKFVAATFDGKVSAYSVSQHTPKWQTQISAPVFAYYRSGSELIVADMGGNLSAIDTASGQIQWQYKVHKNAQFWNVLHQHTLYSLTDTGTLNILDANNGKRLHSLNFARKFAQAPIVQDDLLALFDTEGSTLHVSIDESKMSQTNLNNFH